MSSSKTTIVSFSYADAALTYQVIRNLGEISGNDIEVLHEIQQALRITGADKVKWSPELRDSSKGDQKEIVLPISHVVFLLRAIFGQVRAFTAADIEHVYAIRQKLRQAVEHPQVPAEAGEEEATAQDNG